MSPPHKYFLFTTKKSCIIRDLFSSLENKLTCISSASLINQLVNQMLNFIYLLVNVKANLSATSEDKSNNDLILWN